MSFYTNGFVVSTFPKPLKLVVAFENDLYLFKYIT